MLGVGGQVEVLKDRCCEQRRVFFFVYLYTSRAGAAVPFIMSRRLQYLIVL